MNSNIAAAPMIHSLPDPMGVAPAWIVAQRRSQRTSIIRIEVINHERPPFINRPLRPTTLTAEAFIVATLRRTSLRAEDWTDGSSAVKDHRVRVIAAVVVDDACTNGRPFLPEMPTLQEPEDWANAGAVLYCRTGCRMVAGTCA